MKVRELLDSKDKWSKGWYAEDKDNLPISYNSPDAVKWNLIGAIFRCYPEGTFEILRNISKTNIGDFKDTHSYEEVMKAVKELDI